MAGRIHVLIVDDNVRTREGLRALLTIWPEIAVVGEAVNGEEAIRLVTTHQPDVVLMDVQMPVLDGEQATLVLKRRWPHLRVIVLTMYPKEVTATLAAVADAVLVKGDAPERLLAVLQHASPDQQG